MTAKNNSRASLLISITSPHGMHTAQYTQRQKRNSKKRRRDLRPFLWVATHSTVVEEVGKHTGEGDPKITMGAFSWLGNLPPGRIV